MATKDISNEQACLACAVGVYYKEGLTEVAQALYPQLMPPREQMAQREGVWRCCVYPLMALTGRSYKECEGALARLERKGYTRSMSRAYLTQLTEKGHELLSAHLIPEIAKWEALALQEVTEAGDSNRIRRPVAL